MHEDIHSGSFMFTQPSLQTENYVQPSLELWCRGPSGGTLAFVLVTVTLQGSNQKLVATRLILGRLFLFSYCVAHSYS